MYGNYWVVEVERGGSGDFECIYAATAEEACAMVARQPGCKLIGEPSPVEMSWFHVEPLLAKHLDFGGVRMASLSEQFFKGGRIGCKADGLELIFTPDLLAEPREEIRNGEELVIYGNATLDVEGHPELRFDIELEGLDDAHLVDRLCAEVAKAIGHVRRNAPSPAI